MMDEAPHRDDCDFTPTDARVNRANEEAAAANPSQDIENGNDLFEDPDDAYFTSLNLRHDDPDKDWSRDYKSDEATKLLDYSKAYYEQQTREEVRTPVFHFVMRLTYLFITKLANDCTTQDARRPTLIQPDICTPESGKTPDQNFLIYHHLYHEYINDQYLDAQSRQSSDDTVVLKPPPQQNILVEGRPGTGKSHCTNVLRNVSRSLHGMDTDKASTPTGCSAVLIDGCTHYRSCAIPTGQKFRAKPCNCSNPNSLQMMAMRKQMSRIQSRFMDEHSMAGRSMWAWLEHRHEEFRRPCEMTDDDGTTIDVSDKLQQADTLDPLISCRPWGGIPFIYSCGDSHQLPAIAQKPCYSKERASSTEGSDFCGMQTWSRFINPTDESETECTIVVMEDVLRQGEDQRAFKDALSHMREGTVNFEDVELLLSRCLEKLPPEERQAWRADTLHLVSTWREAHEHNFNYLNNDLDAPIALFKAKFESNSRGSKNCCVKETSLPARNALCVGATVMLLMNFIVEVGLMNGAVGIIRDIRYCSKEGPNSKEEQCHLSHYLVVEIPDSTLPEHVCLVDGYDSKHVPIPVVQQSCERHCCSVKAIPLRICRAITIHKCQGMTVGEEEITTNGKTRNKHPFKRAVVHLPPTGGKAGSTPGLALVAFSRVTKLEYLAIGNRKEDLNYRMLLNIGKSPAYEKRREYFASMKAKAAISQARTISRIEQLDSSAVKTYKGGCQFLLNWFNSKVANKYSDNS